MLRGLKGRLRLYTLTLAELIEHRANNFVSLKTLNLSKVCDGIRLETNVCDNQLTLSDKYRTEFDLFRGRVMLEYMLAIEYYELTHPGQLEDWKKALLGELRLMLDPGLVELPYSSANKLMNRLEVAINRFINNHVLRTNERYRFDLIAGITKEIDTSMFIPVMWVYDYLLFGEVNET